jgi:hypothetical protein
VCNVLLHWELSVSVWFRTVMLSEANDLRLCEKRSYTVKMTGKKWLHRANKKTFHTVSLTRWAEMLRCAQHDKWGNVQDDTGEFRMTQSGN